VREIRLRQQERNLYDYGCEINKIKALREIRLRQRERNKIKTAREK